MVSNWLSKFNSCRYSTACATAANVSVDNIEIKSISNPAAAAVAALAAAGQGRGAEINSSPSSLARSNNDDKLEVLIEPPNLGQAGGRSPDYSKHQLYAP